VPEQVTQPLSISVTMVDDQGTRSDNTQPPLTVGSGPIQKVAQRVIAGVTGSLRGVRWYSPAPNSCPDGTMITADIQGVAPNGSPDGNTVASGSALFSSQYIPLPTGPFVTADQQFSVVFSVSNTCTITPASIDSNPTEGWVYTSSWQRLSDYDGRSDIGMGTIVEPPAGLVPTRSFLGAHTATRLNDGRVLIVGQSQQAQIFDPITGLITGTGSTNVLRSQNHRATLLDNGKVLVTGGQTNTGSSTIYLDSAELYDPGTGSFQLLASTLSGVRANHTSTKLADGKVLITGGSYYDASNVYHTRNTAVIYDPSTNSFTPVGNMIASRERHTATLLKSPDNRVFVFGGWQDGDNRGEFFDPNTLTFSATTGFPNAYHGGGHTATLLDDGKVLIAGGWNSNETTDVVELFDPNVGGGTFTLAGTMLHPRQYHAAAKLADGSVLLSGGLFDAVCCILHQPHASLERYVPGTGIVAAGSMLASRYEHVATPLQSGQVLFTGTFGWSFGASHTGELYDPATAVSVANPILPAGSNGSAYGVVLNGRGGTGPYTISQLSGALPTGMSYTQSTRTLSGVPGQSGSFTLAMSVIDNAAHTRYETITLPVNPIGVTTIQLPSSHAGVPYSASVVGTGVGTLTFSIFAGSLPPGLNMASNGAVSGTTTANCCFYGITVKVVDSIGQVSIRGVGISAQP
jgi:Putative Ig domain/Galactose oxidase, central domain